MALYDRLACCKAKTCALELGSCTQSLKRLEHLEAVFFRYSDTIILHHDIHAILISLRKHMHTWQGGVTIFDPIPNQVLQ